MKLLRAIGIGILLWALIFLEVSVLMFGFKLQGSVYYIIHFTLLFLIILLMSLWYFYKSKGGILNGFLLGVIFIIVEIILDSIITIPFFVQDYGFLIDFEILAGELMILVICTIVGFLRK